MQRADRRCAEFAVHTSGRALLEAGESLSRTSGTDDRAAVEDTVQEFVAGVARLALANSSIGSNRLCSGPPDRSCVTAQWHPTDLVRFGKPLATFLEFGERA